MPAPFRSLLALLPMALAGCVHSSAYPGRWEALPAASPNNACQSLAGNYRDAGEDGYSSPDVSLYDVLYGYDSGGNEPEKALYTSIRFPAPDRLVIAVYGSGGLLHQASYQASLGQFACSNGSVVISSKGPVKTPLAYGRYRQTLSLSRTPGHLVVNDKQSNAGVILILPAIVSANTWYRFERMDVAPVL